MGPKGVAPLSLLCGRSVLAAGPRTHTARQGVAPRSFGSEPNVLLLNQRATTADKQHSRNRLAVLTVFEEYRPGTGVHHSQSVPNDCLAPTRTETATVQSGASYFRLRGTGALGLAPRLLCSGVLGIAPRSALLEGARFLLPVRPLGISRSKTATFRNVLDSLWRLVC